MEMRFVRINGCPGDVPRKLPSERHFGTFIRRLWDISPKSYNYKLFSVLGTYLLK